MTKTVEDWLSYYETLHPLGIDMGLRRIREVWQRLNIDKIAKQKTITIAGTNGKGSACQMLQILLQNKGLKVGCYTSPHLFKFNERITINGQEISDTELIKAFELIEQTRQEITLTHFEATTLTALIYFAQQDVDTAVLEVGLGGRLDAINIIDADAAMITSIGLDHQAYLGNDLSQIALEKAGVFRANKPAVFAGTEHNESVIEFCKTEQIPLLVNQCDYQIDYTNGSFYFANQDYQLPEAIKLLGKHQLENASGVAVLLLTLKLICADDLVKLSDFQLAGRLQQIASKPDVIIDVAHNIAAVTALTDSITRLKPKYRNVIALVAMLKDKDHKEVLEIAANTFDKLVFTSTHGERGFSGDELHAVFSKLAVTNPVEVINDSQQAYKQTLQQLSEDDLLVVFGTFTVITDIFQGDKL